jgi:hypothetical protein
MSGCDLRKKRRANWIWDIHSAFLASPALSRSGTPLLYVTDDRAMLEAAAAAGERAGIATFAEYQSLLDAFA